MKYLFLSFLTIAFIAKSASQGTGSDSYTEYNHISGSKYINAAVTTLAWTDNNDYQHIYVTTALDLSCDRDARSYQHSLGRNFIKAIGTNQFSTHLDVGNKTDDPSHSDGYAMEQAWRWLQQNPTQKVDCTLKYQSSAAFSAHNINVTFGGGEFPLSVSYSGAQEIKSIAIKSANVEMKGDFYSSGSPDRGCIAHCTPLIIDMLGNGTHLGEKGIGIEFDILADGNPIKMQWVKPKGDEAFLAIDHNHNGKIDDGSELFGNGTRIITEDGSIELAPNGFVALAQYDLPQLGGDNDGYITKHDDIWQHLLIWHDINADGKSHHQEISPLNLSYFDRLEITPKHSGQRDDAGNLMPYWSWIYSEDHNYKTRLVDVYFKILKK